MPDQPRSYRRAALLVAAILCFTRGLAYLPITPGPDKLPTGLAIMSHVIPLPVWAGIWITVGLVCVTQCFTTSSRLAWSIFPALYGAWGLAYILGWLFVLHFDPSNREWLTGVTYLGPAIIMIILAGRVK